MQFNQKLAPPLLVCIFVALVLCGFFIYVQIIKLQSFSYNESDLAIINQVFHSIINGMPFYSSYLNHSYLGDHVNFIILLILPFYYFFQHPLTLLAIQSVFVFGSGIVLYFYVRELLKRSNAKYRFMEYLPLIMALVWLFNPFLQRANLYGFHFLTLAPLPLFLLLLVYEKKKFGWYVLFLILSLSVREDLSFIIILFSIIPWKEGREKKWIFAPLGLGFLFLILTFSIIQSYSPIGLERFNYYYGWLTNIFSAGSVEGLNVLSALGNVLSLGNLDFILGLLVSFALLPLFSWRWLLVSSPLVLGLVTFSSGVSGINLFMHYSVPVLAIFIIATGNIIIKAMNRENYLGRDWRREIIPLLPFFLIIALVVLNLKFSPIIYALDKALEQKTGSLEQAALHELLQKIDSGASVLASDAPMVNLSQRDDFYRLWLFLNGKQLHSYIDHEFRVEPKYVLIDESELIEYTIVRRGNIDIKQALTRLRSYLIDNNFVLIDQAGDWWLFVRGDEPEIDENLVKPALDLSQLPCDDLYQLTNGSGMSMIITYTPWLPDQSPLAPAARYFDFDGLESLNARRININGGLELDSLGSVFFKEDNRELSDEVYVINFFE